MTAHPSASSRAPRPRAVRVAPTMRARPPAVSPTSVRASPVAVELSETAPNGQGGLGARAPSRAQCVADQAVEDGARGAGAAGAIVSATQLTEDLGLAEHRGLEPGGGAHQVARGDRSSEGVHVRHERLGGHRATASQAAQQRGLGPVAVGGHGVRVDASARGQDERLARRPGAHQGGRRGAQGLRRDGEALAPSDRRGVLGDAQADELAHAAFLTRSSAASSASRSSARR